MKKALFAALLLLLCLLLSTAAGETPETLVRLTGDPLPSLPAEMWTETSPQPLVSSSWLDATPPALLGMDWRIARNAESCASLLLTQDAAYLLGYSFGGFGVTSAVPCDADDNGTPDLLFTYSWGSGWHRSILAVLNLTTQELIPLACWPRHEADLIVLPPTLSTDSPLSSYAIAAYPVCLADVSFPDPDNLAALRISPGTPLGSVIINRGLTLDFPVIPDLILPE